MPDILVVEDDENLNRGITFSLKKSGYEVFSAESVKKAKRIASDNVIPRFKFSSSSTTSIPGIASAPLFINYFSSSLHICSASISSVMTFPVISL